MPPLATLLTLLRRLGDRETTTAARAIARKVVADIEAEAKLVGHALSDPPRLGK